MNDQSHRDDMARRSRQKSHDARDIGPPPPIVNPARRAEGESSLRRFAELYFPARFYKPWSPNHLQVIARLEDAIRHGGLFALAMPRGDGKTSLCEVAALWAALTGLHRFIMLLPVSATRAKELLADGIKVELLTNDLLAEDFPEVCHPIRALEDRANRAKGQHIAGEPTYIRWAMNEIVLPTVQGSKASGAVIRVAGITGGGVRGAKYVRPSDGANVRPTLAILDDPQSNEIARSPYQVQKRLSLIHGAVLGMAGPGQKITALCPCTVIAKDDLADSLLDRKKSPLWTGQRYQLLQRWPERMDLWQEYADRRSDELRNDGDGHLATAWYGQQKDEMDKGAIASWPERFNVDELSAVQHALNLYYQDARAFAAEYQNDPLPDEEEGEQLRPDAIASRVNGLPRGVVPLSCSLITAYVDVHKEILYWLVAAWSDRFDGAILDYGTYPDQKRPYFAMREAQRTLRRAAPGAGMEGAIYAGLEKIGAELFGREWRREDGTVLKLGRLLVDANWGETTDVVKTWCRRTPHATNVMPSHGRGIGASSKDWSEYQKRPGERLGFHWLVAPGTKHAVPHVNIDTNFWKSFVAARLTVATADRGALTLFGKTHPKADHRMLSEHCCAEYRIATEGRGRKLEEWKIRPEKGDNHLFDCLIGSAVAASIQGAALPDSFQPAPKPRPMSLEEMKRRAKELGKR